MLWRGGASGGWLRWLKAGSAAAIAVLAFGVTDMAQAQAVLEAPLQVERTDDALLLVDDHDGLARRVGNDAQR